MIRILLGHLERFIVDGASEVTIATGGHHAIGKEPGTPPAVHKLDPKLLITHRFKLDRIFDAYDTFENVAKTKAFKVIIET